MWTLPLFAALGCNEEEPECPEGLVLTVSGNCIAIEEPTYDPALIEHWPACELATPSDRFDVEAACADGICAGDTYAEMVDAAGPGECENATNGGFVFCDWLDGTVAVDLDDANNDSVPDADATAYGVFLRTGYDGFDENGLGMTVSMACWADTFGYTDNIESVDGRLSELHWSKATFSLIVSDDEGATDGGPDGLPDHVSLFE